jgi:hypothetical protein
MDVAPTILQHFDLPIPADMLGKVIDGSRAYSAEDLENSIPFEGKPQVSDVARLILHEFGN